MNDYLLTDVKEVSTHQVRRQGRTSQEDTSTVQLRGRKTPHSYRNIDEGSWHRKIQLNSLE